MSSSSLELLWLSVCFAGLSSSFASSGSNNQGQFLSSLRSVAIPGHCLQLRVVCFTPNLLGNSTPFIFYPAIGWTFSTQVFTVFSSLATVSISISPFCPSSSHGSVHRFLIFGNCFYLKLSACARHQATEVSLPSTVSVFQRHRPCDCGHFRLFAHLFASPSLLFVHSSLRLSAASVLKLFLLRVLLSSLDCVCFYATSVNCSRLHFASTSVTVCTVPVFTSTQALFWLNFSTVKHSSFTNLHRPFVGRPQRASTVYQQVTFLSLSFILLCSIYYIILYFTLCPIWYIPCCFFENPTVIHSHL